MGKYDNLPLNKVKARTVHQCNRCGAIVKTGDYYYTQRNQFLQFLHRTPREFCSKCYGEYGDSLVTVKNKHDEGDRSKKPIGNNEDGSKKSKKLDTYL
ncbi:MAG TPA: hypothetical protein VMT01_01210 [Candidatus Acidoferrum sp.]|nr:hypothetical protein [Candidatus Acidoferrum sp.]